MGASRRKRLATVKAFREVRARKRRADGRTAAQKNDATGASKSNTLCISLQPGQTPDTVQAENAIAGIVSNATTAVRLSRGLMGELDLTAYFKALQKAADRVQQGDLGCVEAQLTAQTSTLNAMFTELIRRATGTDHLNQFECFMRLALKAQSQCRATAETLAAMKNPPVFARQANIAHGPQQVNNSLAALLQAASSRAEDSGTAPNKLLEANGERLDLATTPTTGKSNPLLAAVGARNRPTNA